ncbi:MAG: putative glycoside hydrolase, partial [Gemmatimonadota bacterium]
MFDFNELGNKRTGIAAGALTVLVVAFAAFSRTAPAPDTAADAAAATEAASTEPGSGEAVAAAAAAADAAALTAAGDGSQLPPITDAMFAFQPITDGAPRMRKPDAVRGLYLNAWAAGSTAKLAKLIDIANRTEINSFVIDVKEGGEVSYRSRVPLAGAIGADRAYIGDVRGMLRKLREAGIYPIARIVVFRDAVLADAYSELSVQHVNGGEWQDRDGHRWVDSFNRKVWDYNIALAREALELGFAEVQWDYVRFPDVPQALMRTAAWPAQEGRTKADGIRAFLLYSRQQLAKYDAPVTADVFGLTTSAGTDMGIGQYWEKMADATDVLLPMVYPSHYAKGSYGIAHPNA